MYHQFEIKKGQTWLVGSGSALTNITDVVANRVYYDYYDFTGQDGGCVVMDTMLRWREGERAFLLSKEQWVEHYYRDVYTNRQV